VRGNSNDDFRVVFALSVNDFAVPEHKEIVDTAESIQACREDPDVHAECKNILKQYFEMKDKTGEPYVNLQ